MLRILADENFRDAIVRGLLRRQPGLDIIRVQDVGLRSSKDPEILAWAGDEGRILLTHDRSTVPDFAYERIDAGLAMPGVFVLGHRFPTGPAIEQLILLDSCSDQDEWDGRVIHLPVA